MSETMPTSEAHEALHGEVKFNVTLWKAQPWATEPVPEAILLEVTVDDARAASAVIDRLTAEVQAGKHGPGRYRWVSDVVGANRSYLGSHTVWPEITFPAHPPKFY